MLKFSNPSPRSISHMQLNENLLVSFQEFLANFKAIWNSLTPQIWILKQVSFLCLLFGEHAQSLLPVWGKLVLLVHICIL